MIVDSAGGGSVSSRDDNYPPRAIMFSPTPINPRRRAPLTPPPEVPFEPTCGPPDLPFNYEPTDAAIRAGVDALPSSALALIAERNGTRVVPTSSMPPSHVLVPQPAPSQDARYQMMLEELQNRQNAALELLRRDIV